MLESIPGMSLSLLSDFQKGTKTKTKKKQNTESIMTSQLQNVICNQVYHFICWDKIIFQNLLVTIGDWEFNIFRMDSLAPGKLHGVRV